MESARRRTPENWAAGAVALATVSTLVWAAARTGRVEVTGSSMRPALEPGDRLLILRPGGPWRPLREGDVVAVADPRTPAAAPPMLVKRVTALEDTAVRVEGDNPGSSTDSRVFGAVDRARVIGRAVYRYHPPERVGRL